MKDSLKPELPVDGNHALLIGNLLGAFMREDMQRISHTEAEPVVFDSGEYSNQILVNRGSGTYLITVEKITEGEE